jgi:hypothetical protein
MGMRMVADEFGSERDAGWHAELDARAATGRNMPHGGYRRVRPGRGGMQVILRRKSNWRFAAGRQSAGRSSHFLGALETHPTQGSKTRFPD